MIISLEKGDFMNYNNYDRTVLSEKISRGVIMLINFKVKNFLSIKDLQTLSMVSGATKRKSERIVQKTNFGLLKFSAIFGANASGKSNIIKAFQRMKTIVLKGTPKYIVDEYFKFDSNTIKDNTYFEVELAINDKFYAYGFQINFINNAIVDEWLIELKNNKEYPIFERNVLTSSIDRKDFSKEISKKLDVYIDDVKSDKNILFLTYLNQNKAGFYKTNETQIFRDIYLWFENQLNIANPETIITSGRYYIIKEHLKQLAKFLSCFDTGITDIRIEKSSNDELRLIPSKLIDNIKNDLLNDHDRLKVFLIRILDNFLILKLDKENSLSIEKVCFYHTENNKTPLTLKEESDGTKRLLDLAEIILTDDNNKTYIVDGLDRCLHPQVTYKFVELFLSKAANDNFNNQLIVTTHESRLLNFEILRRDEVWFTQKTEGATSLYSLEEFNERFDKKIDKAYLDGRYGGVPIFETIFPISCIDEDQTTR